jgi:hypothetical protein
MSCSLKTRHLAGFFVPGFQAKKFFTQSRETVGASLLAMDSSAPRLSISPALSFTTIAGKPAPTRGRNCRSQLAGDGLKYAAFIQFTRVIVNDHRWQASSYKEPACWRWTQVRCVYSMHTRYR